MMDRRTFMKSGLALLAAPFALRAATVEPTVMLPPIRNRKFDLVDRHPLEAVPPGCMCPVCTSVDVDLGEKVKREGYDTPDQPDFTLIQSGQCHNTACGATFWFAFTGQGQLTYTASCHSN
jgi:hypothetical protein